MKNKVLILALVLVLSLVAAGFTLANGDYLPRWVLGGGASDSAGGAVTMRGTLGQPVVGVVASGEVTLGQGFWYGGGIPEYDHHTYLPLVQR
jgi:hypothetical protein